MTYGKIGALAAGLVLAAGIGGAAAPAAAKVSIGINIGPPGYYVPYYHPPVPPPYYYRPYPYYPYPYGPYYRPAPYGPYNPYYRYYHAPGHVPYYEQYHPYYR